MRTVICHDLSFSITLTRRPEGNIFIELSLIEEFELEPRKDRFLASHLSTLRISHHILNSNQANRNWSPSEHSAPKTNFMSKIKRDKRHQSWDMGVYGKKTFLKEIVLFMLFCIYPQPKKIMRTIFQRWKVKMSIYKFYVYVHILHIHTYVYIRVCMLCMRMIKLPDFYLRHTNKAYYDKK